MEPRPKRRQLVPVVFDKHGFTSSSEMSELTESGKNSGVRATTYSFWVDEHCYACIISEEINVELEKALKVSFV